MHNAVAHFWNEALRWGSVIVSESGNGAVYRSPSGGTHLEFIRVPEGKTGKNRLHLGCAVYALDDLDAEIERLGGMGAELLEGPIDVAGGLRIAFVKCPQDTRVELLQMPG